MASIVAGLFRGHILASDTLSSSIGKVLAAADEWLEQG
jgi:hypothetical protein